MSAFDSCSTVNDDGYPYNLGINEIDIDPSESTNHFGLLNFTVPQRGANIAIERCDNRALKRWLLRGLLWYYAFHHEEAQRCFQNALEIDSDCAMAHWGCSVCNGPNYNTASMTRTETFPSGLLAYRHAQRAAECLHMGTLQLSSLEVALVTALQCRFSEVALGDDPMDQNTAAFADAMREVYDKHSSSSCAGCLYAEALLNFNPWHLWDLDTGLPDLEHTLLVRRVIEKHLTSTPLHPGLNHFYIHLMEMSPTPEAALPACEVLHRSPVCPDAGHLVHMASHIYVLLGMYEDAASSNVSAQRVDSITVERDGIFNFYTGYRVHNIHFIAYSAMFAGQYSVALEAAQKLRESLPDDLIALPVMGKYFESFRSIDLHVYIRFGKWDAILALPVPTDMQLEAYTIGMYHYARGIASAALNCKSDAQLELDALKNVLPHVPEDRVLHNNTCRSLLELGIVMLSGELFYRQGMYDEAFEQLQAAVKLSDMLVYDEPWGWMVPPRHALGALLLEQANFNAAEEHFRKDMDRSFYGRCHPRNIWAATGLLRCLEMRLMRQQKDEDLEGNQQLDKEVHYWRDVVAELQAKSEVHVQVACMCANRAR